MSQNGYSSMEDQVDCNDSDYENSVGRVVGMCVKLMDSARYDQDVAIPSDDDLARIATAAIKLYAARAEQTGKYPCLLTKGTTATEVIVAVTEMMRFADLNAFDVNMWLGRRE